MIFLSSRLPVDLSEANQATTMPSSHGPRPLSAGAAAPRSSHLISTSGGLVPLSCRTDLSHRIALGTASSGPHLGIARGSGGAGRCQSACDACHTRSIDSLVSEGRSRTLACWFAEATVRHVTVEVGVAWTAVVRVAWLAARVVGKIQRLLERAGARGVLGRDGVTDLQSRPVRPRAIDPHPREARCDDPRQQTPEQSYRFAEEQRRTAERCHRPHAEGHAQSDAGAVL